MTDLKLIALDADDLAVLSANVQDGVLKVEDMAFLKKQHRFAIVFNRFDRLSVETAGKRNRRQGGRGVRRRTALRFERVTRARLQGIDLAVKDRVLVLLALQFEPGPNAPAGEITLLFAGGAAIRLDVECIEAELRDLGAAWRTRSQPKHDAE